MKPFALGGVFGLVICVAVGALGFGVAALAQQGRPQPAQHHPAPLAGKVEVRESRSLPRFREPIKTAPRIHPRDIDGHKWHWHPLYGWVSLPVGTAQFVELGETYALPAQVRVYTAAEVSCQTTCPHCGQPLNVSLR